MTSTFAQGNFLPGLTSRFLDCREEEEKSMEWNRDEWLLPSFLMDDPRPPKRPFGRPFGSCRGLISSELLSDAAFYDRGDDDLFASTSTMLSSSNTQKVSLCDANDLLVSFSSSPTSAVGLWHYENEIFHPSHNKKLIAKDDDSKSWKVAPQDNHLARKLHFSDSPCDEGSSHTDHRPPIVIVCRNRKDSGSLCTTSGFMIDDDDVSLLADNPDEDDDNVWPHATIEVLANVFQDIDEDDGDAQSCVDREGK